jgi:biotin carboxyl carrier protein
MKMEHGLVAPFDGVVEGLSAAVGDQVREGEALARVRSEVP